MPILVLFLFSFAFAESVDIRSLTDKTFTRDNTYCRMGKQKIEIQVRGISQYTEPREKHYGEFFFYYPKKKAKLLPLNQDKLNNYRLFRGQGTHCTKSHGYQIDKDKLAILFLKENRPYKDKLTIQLFNSKSLEPEAVIETEFLTDQAEASPDGFVFQTVEERNDMEMGKVTLKGEEFTFQDREFQIWRKYSLNGFEIMGPLTFQKFPWKKHFKDQTDFFTQAGWDEKEKKFNRRMLYIAFNHKIKKNCLLFTAGKMKLSGTEEGWRCN